MAEDPLKADEFRATLYFDGPPALTEAALIEAWGRENYVCRREEPDGVYSGFRGGTYVIIGTTVPADPSRAPACYPAVTRPAIDWKSTFFVDPKAAYDDLQHATHQADFLFRILHDPDAPQTAHNEIAATLLGIHQTAPMRAVTLHYLGMIVGRANLDDYLSYANSHLEKPTQVASMLSFGHFVTEEAGLATAWTTGLDHFGQVDFLVSEPGMTAFNTLNTVFGLGHLVVHGRRYKANEWLTSFDLYARFAAAEHDGKPALRIEVKDYTPP
jgi:hypothetical protein